MSSARSRGLPRDCIAASKAAKGGKCTAPTRYELIFDGDPSLIMPTVGVCRMHLVQTFADLQRIDPGWRSVDRRPDRLRQP